MTSDSHVWHGVSWGDHWYGAGTGPYLVGMGLIIYGYAFIGFVTQIYGFWKLFASFLPNVIQSLKMVLPPGRQRSSRVCTVDRVRVLASISREAKCVWA